VPAASLVTVFFRAAGPEGFARRRASCLPALTGVPALSKREDLYARPQTFDPGHFLGQKPPTDSRCPFGSGAHACAGQGLAVVIMKTALATIVRKADLKLAQPEVHPVRNAYWYEPNKGMLVVLEQRR
jgi:cytochrome P450